MNDSSSDRDPVEMLAEEFIARKRRGEKPSLTEYLDRYPNLADDIRELFPALLMMEDLGDSSLGSTGPHLAGVPALKQLGDYRILREVGRGGMGVVYEAEQQSLGRRVALKVLPPHALNDLPHVRRFEREARAAARLHHTNIVPVYGVGCHEGTHFYVMQFIAGLGLDGVLEELRQLRATKVHQPAAGTVRPAVRQVAYSLVTGSFSQAESASGLNRDVATTTVGGGSSDSSVPRLPGGEDLSSLSDSDVRYWQSVARIGVQVADALEYAHGQGILHRDIKPSNLLMDMKGTVWVTDFGLAKGDDAENLTHTGDIVGTVRYMAPERFEGHSDARSDVYSLGLTLYELLALRPAFSERDRARLIDRVLHDEPPPLRKVNRAVPRDLETIVQKAIAKEPARRYARAAELAEDLQRFIDDRPIRARPVSGSERTWRWCRRNPALASALALAAVALLAVSVVSTVFAFMQNQNNDALSKVNSALTNAYDDLNDKQTKLEQEQAQTLREKRNTDEALKKYQRLSVLLAAERSRALAERHDPNHALLWLAQALENAPEDAEDLRFPLRANLASLREEHWTAPVIPALDVNEKVVARSSDGKTLLTHRSYGTPSRPPQLVNAATGKPIGEPIPVTGRSGLIYAAFFPDGKRLVYGWDSSSEANKPKSTIGIFDARTGKPLSRAWEFADYLRTICLSADGKYMLTGHGNGAVRLWNAERDDWNIRLLKHDLPNKPYPSADLIHHAEFSPDGTRALTVCVDEVRLWDTATGKAVGDAIRHGGVTPWTVAAISPDGKWIATGGGDQQVRLWDPVTGKPVGTPLRHSYRIRHVGFSPDSQVLLTAAASDGLGKEKCEARFWRPTDGEPLGPFFHPRTFGEMTFSPDGLTLLTVSFNVEIGGHNIAQLWDVESSKPIGVARNVSPALFSYDPRIAHGAFSPDSLSVVTQAGTWPLDATLHLPRLLLHPEPVSCVAFSPDGTRLVTGTRGAPGTLHTSSAYLWDRATGQPRGQPMPRGGDVQMAVFSPDGKLVLTVGIGRESAGQLWDGQSGKPHGPTLDFGFGNVGVGAFSSDGKTVLLGGYARGNLETARLWDVQTGRRVGAPLIHKGSVTQLAYSPDGLRLVTAGYDKTVLLWDARTAQTLGTPMVHTGVITSVAFSPDGKFVLTASQDRTARVWDGLTGAAIRTFQHDNGVTQALFSPSGKTLFTASMDKTGRLWDVQTGQAMGLPWEHSAPVLCAAFSPDGKVVVTGCEDGSARLWAAETGLVIGPPLSHPRRVTAVAFSPDGKTVATVCGDKAVRLWDVPPPLGSSVRRLVLWTQVETGMELDAQGGVHTLDKDVLAKRRRELDELGGPALPSLEDADQKAERHYRMAQACALKDRWWAAAWHLEQTVKLRPKDWAGWLLQARALYHLGSLDPAAAAIKRAFASGPREAVLAAGILHSEAYRSADAPNPLTPAATELARKRKQTAVWLLDQLIANAPASWRLYDRRGWTYAELGEDEKAEADYRKARTLGPEASFYQQALRQSFSAPTGWGPRHLKRKQWDDAAWDYARLVEAGATVEDQYICEADALLRLYRGDTAGYRRVCKELAAHPYPSDKAWNNAWAAWICTYGPDATDNPLTAIAWLEAVINDSNVARTFLPGLGAAYYRAGRFDEAILCLNACTDNYNQGPVIWLMLALAHRRLGHTDEAARWRAREAEWFTKLSQPAKPNESRRVDLDFSCALLKVLQLHKEWDAFPNGEEEALAALSAVVGKNPNEVEPLLRRGRFHANRGQWDKAAADFDRLVELRPQDARSWLERGRFHVQHGQRAQAAADFTQAMTRSPTDMDLRLECAHLRVIARDWSGAAADFRQAINVRPDDALLRLECGEAEAWAGLWDQAAADFALVVEKQPQEIQSWVNLALAQLGGGDRAAYRKTCATMRERFGQSPDGQTLSQLYMICAVTPDAKDVLREFAKLAGGLFRNIAYAPWYHYPLPIVYYRADKLPDTVATIDSNIRLWNRNKKAQPLEGLLLAMAHQRLGHHPQARAYLTDAETWIAAADKQEGNALGGVHPAWSDWRMRVIVQALHDEAVALFKEGEKR